MSQQFSPPAPILPTVSNKVPALSCRALMAVNMPLVATAATSQLKPKTIQPDLLLDHMAVDEETNNSPGRLILFLLSSNIVTSKSENYAIQ